MSSPFWGRSSQNQNQNQNQQNGQNSGQAYPNVPPAFGQQQIGYGQNTFGQLTAGPSQGGQMQPYQPQYTNQQVGFPVQNAQAPQQQQGQSQQLQQSQSQLQPQQSQMQGQGSQLQSQQPGVGGFGGAIGGTFGQSQVAGYAARTVGGFSGATGYGYNAGGTSNSIINQMQQIEEVQRDEDPIYGPLARACKKVERGLKGDEEISLDIEEKLFAQVNPNIPEYVNPPSQSHSFRPLKIGKTTPLPDDLMRELQNKDATANMGLFEDIDRAWFTVDRKLFLWNYNDGQEFSRYDEQPSPITCVGLVKAKKDVFIDDITHVLLICTSSKITLLGLTRPKPHEINLFATNLSADLPVGATQITGATSGRVFLLGTNKHLYELSYSSETSWLSSGGAKAQIINRSGGWSSDWMPAFLSGDGKEGVIQFVIDSTQERLFTLRSQGQVEMFDISKSEFASKGRMDNLQSQGPKGAKIVNIAIISPEESRRYNLVAIFNNGTRAYVALGEGITTMWRNSPNPENIKLGDRSFYSSGTFFGVEDVRGTPTESSRLHVTIPNSGSQSAARENFNNPDIRQLQEWYQIDGMPSLVWSIAEVPAAKPSNLPPSLRRGGFGTVALNPLSRQATTEARTFLILSHSGISFAVQPRPLDMLSGDIELDKETAASVTRNTFGGVQLASMGVMIGCQATLANGDYVSIIETLLRANEPVIKDDTAGRRIEYTSRHDGLALTLARFLRPIWQSRVTAVGMGNRQMLGVSEYQLQTVQSRLEQLKRFIEQYAFPRGQAEGDKKTAWDQEELSLHAMGVLIKQAIEAISFVLLLNDYKMPDVVARTDMAIQQNLSNLTFKDLFVSPDAKEIAKKLVTALIEQQIGQELGIDSLSKILQERCGSFCQPGDVVMYKAEENLRRAESARDSYERQEALGESLRLFTKAADAMDTKRIRDVARRYRALQHIPGAIELTLSCISRLDPMDRALDYVRDGRQPSDKRKALFDVRQELYEEIITTLKHFDTALEKAVAAGGDTSVASQKRDEAYRLAIASDDRLFHYYLYDWHNESGYQERLLDFTTPYIEEYLIMTSNDVEDRRDLLWKYYSRSEDYFKAARALYELATRPSPMTLSERSYYLAQALAAAKSAGSYGADDVEFTNAIQERMDVAQVQAEVVRGIEGHSEMTYEEKEQELVKLNGDLLGLDELYQNFARPFRLYEPILLILKTADTRLDDVCEAVWRQLLQSAPGAPLHVAMAELVVDLLRKYYPSEGAPVDIVIPTVYSEAASIARESEEGWATRSLIDGGIPIRECWEVIMNLHDQAASDEEREFCTEEIGVMVERWVDDRDSIPLADVERFVSAYMLRSTAGHLNDRMSRTRDRMNTAKRAIKAW